MEAIPEIRTEPQLCGITRFAELSAGEPFEQLVPVQLLTVEVFDQPLEARFLLIDQGKQKISLGLEVEIRRPLCSPRLPHRFRRR